ncbi:MAG TPA: winged helix-turn-helix domain-containing tetratricopeptide repeat protein [Acetobacteraceae bacterium]|nr:winged helix-turn-helix domain-containing tetratricopeptide repeat protein [Acetobacteraceae bacterium]
MASEEISFGRFQLDLARPELRRDGQPVPLHRRALGILCVLAEAKGEIVRKDDLIARLWPGRIVEEGNLHVHVSALRKSLDEHGEGHSFVVTVPGRGYRLAHLASLRSGQPTEGSLPPQLPLPDKPSIAVLPFQNMSGDPEQEYFADGMVEQIITALSRIRWLFVIARNSSFTYKGRAVDVKQFGRELGVRYVVEGSVRKGGNRVRIAAQLIEAESGAHIWADHFDSSLEDVLDLQDRVAMSVAGVIEPALRAAEVRRAVERPRPDLTAYDLYLRARRVNYAWEKQDYVEALDRLSAAIEQAPAYGPALALSAWYHMALYGSGWTDEPEASRQRAIGLARRAAGNASDDADTLGRAAYVLAACGEDIDAATALIDRSLQINPSFADGWRWSGWLRLWAGCSPDIAIEHLERASRLDPLDPRGETSLPKGIAHFFARRLDQARAMLLLSLQENPGWVPTHRFLAACYAYLGEWDEAKMIIKRLRALTQEVLPKAEHWRDPEQREFFLSGLRLAMSETE